MDRSSLSYKTYLHILQEELVPATGCTEPISIAFGAAKAREVLGAFPERAVLSVSGNILKNVKSVVVPGTGGLKGIKAAAAAGIVAGDASAELQVIAKVSEADKERIADFIKKTPIEVKCAQSPIVFDMLIELFSDNDAHSARVRIVNSHKNIVFIQKDENTLLDEPVSSSSEAGLADKSLLNITDIVDFADTVEICEVESQLKRWVEYNSAISEEGLKNDWGACIGKLLLSQDDSLRTRARAAAAAGSDARMSGCEMPVVILSGSGNQGLTASMPVVTYAKSMGLSDEKLYRALIVSALITAQQKAGIGRLSAYCGATSAGVGAGAGVAYLHGADAEQIGAIVKNAVAMLSGMVCDGAKPSCAAKIAAAVDAGLLGWEMSCRGRDFNGGDGFLSDSADRSIENVGRMARAMRETDEMILQIMTEN